MVRSICLFICILILLTSCNNSKPQDVSRNNHERIEKEEQEKWEITDALGNKQTLDISNVPVMNQNVEMEYIYYPAEYAQISDGHYYYMTHEDKSYTIFMDHGTKVGSFHCNEGYILEGCVRYKDKFYITYLKDDDDSEVKEFGQVDFESGTVRNLFTEMTWESSDFYTQICSNQIFFTDAYTQETLINDFEGKYVKSIQPPEEGGEWWKASLCGLDGKNLYYHSINSGRNRNKVIYVNWNTGTKGTVLEYQIDKLSSEEVYGVSEIVKCDEQVYISETLGKDYHHRLYVIDAKRRKMQLVSDYIREWTVSDRYIFYTDKKHRIHRFDKTNEEDKIISKIKAGDIKCTENELYVREYDSKVVDNSDDACPDDYFTEIESVKSNIYAMDFDGKNMEKITD